MHVVTQLVFSLSAVDQEAHFMESTCGIPISRLPSPPRVTWHRAITTTTTSTVGPLRTDAPAVGTRSPTTTTEEPSEEKGGALGFFEDMPICEWSACGPKKRILVFNIISHEVELSFLFLQGSLSSWLFFSPSSS